MADIASRDPTLGKDNPPDDALSPTSSTALGRIRNLLTLVSAEEVGKDGPDRYVEDQCDRLRELHIILIDTSHRHGRVKDDFRHADGFDVLLGVVGNVSSLWELTGPNRTVFELLKLCFLVLSEVLLDHRVNGRHFSQSGGTNRWHVLQRHLLDFQSIILLSSTEDTSWLRRLLNLVFSFTLREDADSRTLKENNPQSGQTESTRPVLGGSRQNIAIIWIPEALSIIAHLCTAIASADQPRFNSKHLDDLLSSTARELLQLMNQSHWNAVSMADSDIVEVLCSSNLHDHLQPQARASVGSLRRKLLSNGSKSSSSALEICREAFTSTNSLLEALVNEPSQPPHIALDLSLHGYASLEIAALPGPFPPNEQAGGYTFMAWLCIDDYDEACHTTLFGAFDGTQTCFVLLYLERETKRLVLQTSVKSDRPSIRFKCEPFAAGRWYHVAIVHKHPGATNSGRATLIIDGVATEKVKCAYPMDPPRKLIPRASSKHLGMPPAPNLAVQAFLGTPTNIAPRLGTGTLHSRWSLASCQLVARALPEELIFVYKNLGPEYVGSFQDCLGSFQTYETSTNLSLMHERLYAGSDDQSVIAQAIKGRAGAINDGGNFLLNLSAASCDSGVLRDATKPLSSSSVTAGEGHYIFHDDFLNLASPPSASTFKKQVAVLHGHGGFKLARARSIGHFVWRMSGGIAFAIKLLQSAVEEDQILQSIRIIFGLVRDNWRLSEAFEREGGFPMMGFLIRSKNMLHRDAPQHSDEKGSPFSLRLLQLILGNTGYDAEDPTSAVISNPLAYRSLIVDSDIWRSAEEVSQRLYYKQYVDLIAHSRYRQFNIKRLSRMRPVKRLINAFKSEQMSRRCLPLALETLQSFLSNMPSSEAYRAIALYITYATANPERSTVTNAGPHRTPTSILQRTLRKSQSIRSISTTFERDHEHSRPSSFDIGAQVLKVFSHLMLDDSSSVQIRKFARTVTNKWCLHLLSCESETVIGPCMQILSRLLVVQGPRYLSKFENTCNGLQLLKLKLRKWWHVQSVWESCIAVMFGIDPIEISSRNKFDVDSIAAGISKKAANGLYCPSVFSVMASMLEVACRASKLVELSNDTNHTDPGATSAVFTSEADQEETPSSALIAKVLKLLRDAQDTVPAFNDFCVQSNFTRDILRCIFARLSGAGSLLSPKDGFSVSDPHHLDLISPTASSHMPVSMRGNAEGSGPRPDTNRRRRRQSSFVLVPSKESIQALTSDTTHQEDMPDSENDIVNLFQNDELLMLSVHLLVRVLAGQILERKDFTGLGLFHKAPACSFTLRASVNAYMIRETMHNLQDRLRTNPSIFNETRVLMNLARFSMQALEAYTEGWLVYGALRLVKFNVAFLQYWQQPSIQAIKDVRLCSPSLYTIRSTLARTTLFHVAKAKDSFEGLKRLISIVSLPDWSTAMGSGQDDLMECTGPLFCAILRLLPQAEGNELEVAQSALHILIESRQQEVLDVFEDDDFSQFAETLYDFVSALHGSTEAFRDWLEEYRKEVGDLSRYAKDSILMPFIALAEKKAAASVDARSAKREERLEELHLEDLAASHSWTEHQLSARNWTDNIVRSEAHKYARSQQDQNETFEYLRYDTDKLLEPLGRLGLTDTPGDQPKWQLDECEGRDRMRLRLAPSQDVNEIGYEPKSTKTARRKTQSLVGSRTQSNGTPQQSRPRRNGVLEVDTNLKRDFTLPSPQVAGENFEIINDQPVDEEEEDKNRKVMRSLQRGEHVLNAFNVSRIVGLEAHEGLLIIGRTSLYLVDGLFQQSDGEVVNVDQARADERDQYTRILSGHEVEELRSVKRKYEPTRHWPWLEILSFSKRNFLTRPVAVEVFFTDGRSYLLTTTDEEQRNSLYADLLKSTSKTREAIQVENEAAWRKDLLRNPGEGTSKLSQLLSPMVANPMTKKWIKGEVSNFHYLMWINSQAGRTFNDLTQYPVFPWVLADYTSKELDLSNPRSFRDLSKPMGCQTIERAESFKERYNSLAEMDEQTPPFHYGTHYSSAMTVTSFLIRLQPFAQSHVLLQGGSFDHANRLFHSVEQAWRSAGLEGLSDVRELIPEFYCLSDFLVNVNKYNFGLRQGDNENVDDVKLPPWAKGSPEIFIAKHREALESPYVSQNLHAWIDLIFGFKQRGEAARESTNVFHYLSYPGAKDLDVIDDQHERAATIGIIHNFGQTPRQIFLRPHDRREHVATRSTKLRESMRSLAKLRSPIQQMQGGVASLHYSRSLVAAATSTCLGPPFFDVIVDWTSADQSLRFYSSDRRKRLGLHEQLHDGAITTAVFADSATLFTGSDDGTVTAWHVNSNGDSVELQLRSTLFGHRARILAMAVSRAFSVLLTASIDGKIIVWDLNRLEYIRQINVDGSIRSVRISDSSGRILVCCRGSLQLYTINGRLLLDQSVCDAGETLTTCAYYQQSTNAWYDSEILLSGHTQGIVKVWNLTTSQDGVWTLELLNRLPTDRYIKAASPPSITALLAQDQKVWAGDSAGYVYEWNAVR